MPALEEHRAHRSRLARGMGRGTAHQIQPESKGPPPVCRNSFPHWRASSAREYPAQAGSTSRRPEIPREESSGASAARPRPACPGIWGPRSNAVLTADCNGLTLKAWHHPHPLPRRSSMQRPQFPSRQSGAQIRSLYPLGSSLSSRSQSNPDVVMANGRRQSIKSG